MMKYKHQKDASNLDLKTGPSICGVFSPQSGKPRIDPTYPTTGLGINSLEDILLWGDEHYCVVPEGG